MAPPGHASATAAKVSNLAELSKSTASADRSKSQAQAAVISLGGKPALGTGGTQAGEGESGGALVDTADKLPARAQVAPWKASAKGSKNSAHRSSRGSAALARVEVPDTAKVGLLTSDAAAEHSAGQSTGTSTSDAADLSLGDTTRIVLLHSEVDSNAKGHSYLVNLSGTEIGTDEQLGKSCALDASGVASLACLTVSGGAANGITTGGAEVLGVQTALALNPVSAFATAGSTATGSIPPILQSVAAAVPTVEAPRAAAAATPSAELPRTGVAAASTAASALAALLSGLGLRRFGRRRRTAR